MRQALGNTFVLNVVIVIVIIMMALIIGSLSYTKAFKVKNLIISTIEEHEKFDDVARSSIESSLAEMGYRINRNGVQRCKVDATSDETALTNSSSYRYCVVQRKTAKGVYYRVTSYMYFDFPIIGEKLEFPVYGETRMFYNVK